MFICRAVGDRIGGTSGKPGGGTERMDIDAAESNIVYFAGIMGMMDENGQGKENTA